MKKLFTKLLTLSLVTALALSLGGTVSAGYNVMPTKIEPVSKKSRTVKKGKVIELKVLADGDDDYLYWTITKGKGVVKFNDNDRSDDDIELIAKKAGTAKVVCKIKGTNKKVTFKVKVKKTAKSKYITAKKAKNIAYKDAGVKASAVYSLVCKRDNDDGRVIYDIDFNAGNYEYDYEINAKSGKIIEKDKDFID